MLLYTLLQTYSDPWMGETWGLKTPGRTQKKGILDSGNLFKGELSSCSKPWLGQGYIGDEILPNYMGVSLNNGTPQTPQNDHF